MVPGGPSYVRTAFARISMWTLYAPRSMAICAVATNRACDTAAATARWDWESYWPSSMRQDEDTVARKARCRYDVLSLDESRFGIAP